MKYIVDIKNETPTETIDNWVSENNYRITHTFSHFEKMYIVESDNPIELVDFIERLVIDDHSTAVSLHSTTDLFTVTTSSDDDWWKTVVIDGVFESESETVNVVRRGTGYTVYLMDSGINDSHEEFTNTTVRQLFSHTDTTTDVNGHGTALASVIAGTKSGITNAELVSVKIFEQGVPTLVSDIMKGLDAIALDYLNTSLGKPAVINMSWTIDRNEFVEDKIRSLLKIGLLPIAAAGNSGISIENVTPAAMAEVATIGSVGTSLTPSDFSNYTGPNEVSFTAGETNYSPGLDYWAPGEYILAASKDSGFTYIAGTSAATAVVSAVLIYHFSKISLEYGKVYYTPLIGLTDQFDETGQVVATIDSLASEFLSPSGHNPFIPSRSLVDLTEKYINCTNKIPGSTGIYDDEFVGAGNGWYTDILYAKKGIALDRKIYDPAQVDSATIAALPAGLVLNAETGVVSGTMDIEMGENKFEIFDTTLTMIRGDKTIESPFQIIYLDMDVITEEFTAEDYANLIVDSDLILQQGQCYKCTFFQNCGGVQNLCVACSPCSNGKGTEELCLPPGSQCP